MIKLYYGTNTAEWKLQADKLFAIEDIESYLSGFNYVNFSNFQYIKNKLNLTIKLDLTQSYSQPLYTNGIRYVSITNTGENTYYYYVKNVEWTSQHTITLTLILDILNTYKYGVDYKLNKKTKIMREHKDRFVKVNTLTFTNCQLLDESIGFEKGHNVVITSNVFVGQITGFLKEYIYDQDEDNIVSIVVELDEGSITPSILRRENINISTDDGDLLFTLGFNGEYAYESKLYRKVDYLSEGITVTLYKEDKDEYVEREAPLNKDWYLVYRNQNDPTESLINPVECYLIPSTETPVNVGSIQAGGRITADNLETGKFYVLYYVRPTTATPFKSITLSTGNTLYIGEVSMSGNDIRRVLIYKAGDNNINAVDYQYTASTSSTSYQYYFNLTSITLNNLPVNYSKNDTYGFERNGVLGQWTSEGTTPLILDGIELLDRTEAKTFKVIKLPYIPSNFSVEAGKLVLTGSAWEHITMQQPGGTPLHCLKLKNLNTKFNYIFKTNLVSPMFPLVMNTTTIDYNADRNDYYESKIYHSDYYSPKLSYDSFAYAFSLERLNLDKFIALEDKDHMNIQYVVTSTINSRFMFIYTDYVADTLGKEDYNNVMPIARNNDITLYNVPYINYIRNGYNYEVKSKNRNIASNIAGFTLSTGATILSWLTAPSALKIPAVIMGVTSMISSLKSTITTTAQSEQDMEAKQVSLKNQSTSVEGADDIDLMSVYAKNRLKYTCYKVSPIMNKLLLDLFYYTGYNSNRLGVPNINTRVWFNYLECEALFDTTSNMSSEIIEELTTILKTGVTFIHKVNNIWDIDQVKENAERSIVGM